MMLKNGFKTLLVFSLSIVAISCTKVEELQKSSTAAQTSLQFITTSLTPGVKNIAYSNQIQVKGGTPDYVFSVTSGSLPPGVTMSSSTGGFSGIISSTASGTYNFTVQVTDTVPNAITSAFSIKISNQLTVTTSALPAAQVGTPYNTTLAVTGGSGTYTFGASNLPAGLSLTTSTGVVSGTPTVAGANLVSFVVTDSDGMVVGKDLTLTVTTPPVITTATLAAGAAGAAYSESLASTGGIAPYSYSISVGALPVGLTLAPAGTFSGTIAYGANVKNSPIAFTVQVTDSVGQTATRALSIAVALRPWIPADPDKPLRVVGSGVAYSEKLFRIGGVGALAFSATGLPAGLTINAVSGMITGTTFAAGGNYPVQFTVTDASGYSSVVTKTLRVNATVPTFFDMGVPIVTGIRGNLGTNGQYSAQWPYPNKITKGDLNNDGFLDVVWTTTNNNRILILFGAGDGTFHTQSEQTVTSDLSSFDPKVADLDGDGKLDVVVSSGGVGGRLYIFKGDNVWAANTITPQVITIGTEIRDIAVGDINNDGYDDIAVANTNVAANGSVYLFFNCRAAVTVAYNAGTPACVVGGNTINYYQVIHNVSNGAAHGGQPTAVWLSDLDADGNLELINTRAQWQDVQIWKGVGNGTFSSVSQISTFGAGATVRVGNFLGDARKEIVVANTSTIHRVYQINADTTFVGTSTALDNPTSGGTGFSMDVGDLNADGYDDIVIAQINTWRDNIGVFKGGLSALTRSLHSVGNLAPGGVSIGLFTGGARPDIAIARGNTSLGWSPLLIYKNNMQASAISPNYYYLANPPASDVATITEPAFADLDRDGYRDVILKIAGASSIMKGSASGALTLQNYQISNGETALWSYTSTHRISDFNGDGYWDYASVNGNGGGMGTATVVLGNGDGTFGSQTAFAVNQSGCVLNLGGRAIDVADINLDGKPDLIIGTGCSTAPGAQAYIYYGYGDGTFNTASPVILAGAASFVDSVLAEDLNGDNFIDVILGDQNGQMKTFRGTGAGTFAAPITLSVGIGGNLYNIYPADFNADGILDLALASYAASTNYSTILLASNLSVSSQATSGGSVVALNGQMLIRYMQVADMNADGKLDIVLGKGTNTGWQMIWGNNDGTFAPVLNSQVYELSNAGVAKDGTRCTVTFINADILPDMICSANAAVGVGVMINQSY